MESSPTTSTRLTNFKSKVSSTQEGSGNFSKLNMFDTNAHTCWNSKQGSPQWVLCQFDSPLKLDMVKIMFQGGFVGICTIIQYYDDNGFHDVRHAYDLADNNSLQTLVLESSETTLARTTYRIMFTQSSDFYGRIIVYNMELYGSAEDTQISSVT